MTTDPPNTPPNVPSPEAPLPLTGERVTFTGILASMTHRQGQELVERHGGLATEHISKKTTLLIVGEEGWPLEADGAPSVKLQQAVQWQQAGVPLRILTEGEWLQIIVPPGSGEELRRHYTPAMLSQQLGVPLNIIRGWARGGLIQPVRQVHRLAYFDYQEAAGARRLVELLRSGVTHRQIAESLEHLRQMLPGVARPLSQLDLLAADGRLVYRDAVGLVDPLSGQRQFDFEPPEESASGDPATLDLRAHWTSEDWQQAALRDLDEGDLAAAVEAFRMALMDHADRADVHFQLAETLYRQGNLAGALERYHMAVEVDGRFLEAWTQLGCVRAEQGEPEAAREAFAIALDLHPDFPDAHWHLAQVLQQLGRGEEAIMHWKRYLEFDQRGPWAEAARQALATSE